MIGLILAGGNGMRFSEEGCCKPLLKINGIYLMEYSLQNLAALGVSEAVIVVGRYGPEIREAFGNEYRGISLRYIVQPSPLGLMNALFVAAGVLKDETVVLQLSDEIYLSPYFQSIREMADADFLCGYTVPEDPEQIKENYALLCDGQTILHAEEKPAQAIGEKKGVGFCVFRRECFTVLKQTYGGGSETANLCDFINLLLNHGKRGVAAEIAKEEININNRQKYLYAKNRLESEYE